MDRVWVEADVYEQDLPHVGVGQKVTVTLPYLRDRSLDGEVAYVYPYLANKSRTGKVRVELDNRDGDINGTPLRKLLKLWSSVSNSRIINGVQRSPSNSVALATGQNWPYPCMRPIIAN